MPEAFYKPDNGVFFCVKSSITVKNRVRSLVATIAEDLDDLLEQPLPLNINGNERHKKGISMHPTHSDATATITATVWRLKPDGDANHDDGRNKRTGIRGREGGYSIECPLKYNSNSMLYGALNRRLGRLAR
ncbi:hypothetical protein KEM54_004137 [Ascosphaera aggregata]|nr:hypothetical protein KEM54_004137 [Ascosphaera aggregata]